MGVLIGRTESSGQRRLRFMETAPSYLVEATLRPMRTANGPWSAGDLND